MTFEGFDATDGTLRQIHNGLLTDNQPSPVNTDGQVDSSLDQSE